MTAMDVTIHASFLPHDDPPAAGRAHPNTSFIARGRSSNGRSTDDADAGEDVNAEEMTTAHGRLNPIDQRG
jgi:hypothetical protein